MTEDIPPHHPLENPVIWILVQIAEYTLAILLIRWILPDDASLWVESALVVVLVVILTIANITIRRRFIPR